MALFQISEPGLSAAPHEHRLAIGIDLGTTNSLVASVISGVAEVIADENGDVLLPSAVHYGEDGEVTVGRKALVGAVDDAANTITSAKRLIGRKLENLKDVHAVPYRLVDDATMVKIETRAGVKSPIEVSSEILRNLANRAESRLGGDLTGAVITVPAYFDDAQRQATKDAARLANLTVLRLLNEPTAAALAYGLDNAAEGLYLVYDLGGGTFDVSLLKLSKGVFEVLATGGNSSLGGDDYDRAVYAEVLKRLGVDAEVANDLSVRDRRALLQASRSAKEALTESFSTTLIWHRESGDATVEITREEFDALTKELTNETLTAVKNVLKDAKVTVEEVKGVVLVGGATRMPCIRSAVKTLFGHEPLADIDPDRVVAIGAATQANKLAGNSSEEDDWLLLDVTPLSLGLETMGELVEKVIPRNSAIPIARAQDFTTFRDGQTAMAIHVLQGEREVVSVCRSLARFELRGIPPMPAGAARIRVTFQVDADGLLSVTAREMTTGVEASIQVKPSYGLSDEDIIRMLQDGNGRAEEDMHTRELREQQVEARRLLESTHSALEADGDLLSEEARRVIDAQVAELQALVTSEDLDKIKAAIEALSKGTEDFAAQRMDRSIRRALSGLNVEDELFDQTTETEQKDSDNH